MAKISPKLVDETVTTSGYRITRACTVVHITDTTGRTIGEGTHTASGRLRIFMNPLKRHVTTMTDLGAALDEIGATR